MTLDKCENSVNKCLNKSEESKQVEKIKLLNEDSDKCCYSNIDVSDISKIMLNLNIYLIVVYYL